MNLKNEKKIDIKLNIKKIITQTQKSFEQNLTSLKQIISMADCFFNQDEDNYYIEAYKLYKKAKKKKSPRALFQIGLSLLKWVSKKFYGNEL